MKQPWFIYILLGIYFAALVMFLNSEFRSYELSQQISNFKLVDDDNNHNIHKNPRVLLVIIDALRQDYHVKFPLIANTLSKYPNNTFYTKLMVGNPTMTTQRIQSLMIGSQIFSSANILHSFISEKVQVDNIITQLNKHNKQSLILGDNTWIRLFNFSSNYTCDNSYDIHDFDTCDSFIYRHLSSNLNNPQYQFIVAHFLALDHIGHSKSSIKCPQMIKYQSKISQYLALIMQQMDKGTILIITGDHGMRQDGDHGGSVLVEKQTFLFVHYKPYNNEILFQNQKISQNIQQVDITTTLSILLNIPIPINSIGYPILQCLPTYYFIQQKINQRMLLHYKKILSFHNLQYLSCQNNLNNKKYKYTNNIIKQIFKPCLQNLTYNSPNQILSILSINVMCVAFLFYLIYTQQRSFSQIQKIIPTHLLWVCSLFTIFFSWWLIRNSSTCFIFLLFLFMKPDICSYLIILILAQIQQPRIHDYHVSIVHIEQLHQIITSPIVVILFYTIGLIKYLFYKYQNMSINKLKLGQLIILIYTYLCVVSSIAKLTLSITTMVQFWFILCLILHFFHVDSLLLILNMMCILLGGKGPLIIAICWYLVHINQDNNEVLYLLAQTVWWFLGNHYEYSGVDISNSFLLSSQYHWFLNPICLIAHLLAPYALIFILKKKETSQFQYCWKFINIPLAGLISCCVNLYINHEKILFTTVYVPLSVLNTIKVTVIILMTIIVHLLSNRNQKWLKI